MKNTLSEILKLENDINNIKANIKILKQKYITDECPHKVKDRIRDFIIDRINVDSHNGFEYSVTFLKKNGEPRLTRNTNPFRRKITGDLNGDYKICSWYGVF